MKYDRNKIIYKEARKADVECHNASNQKIKNLIDYQLTSFDTGLEKTVISYKESVEI